MHKILVTGCSGYLGGVLTRALLESPKVERVVGLDVAAPRGVESPKFRFHAADVRDEFLLRTVLQEERVDAVFHLAFAMGEPKDAVRSREINVGGTLTVLEACHKTASVKRLILSASASAYGARRGNPEYLTESDPLRADTLLYGVHKRQVEEEVSRALPAVRRGLEVALLRICTIVGRGERGDGPVKTFCALPAGVSVLFHEGGLQFITEQDLTAVMLKALEAPVLRGAFNVAPDDYTTVAEICRALDKPRVPLPYFLLWGALYLARRLGGRLDLSEKVVSYLAYPCVLSNAKVKEALGVRFTRGSLDAFLDCARALAPEAAPAERALEATSQI